MVPTWLMEPELDADGPAPRQTKRDRQNARLAMWLAQEQAHFAQCVPSYVIDPELRIRVGACGGALGTYSIDSKLITISPKHLKEATVRRVRQTILHELVHHYCVLNGERNEGHRHGGLFREIALVLRMKDWADNTWKWEATCPSCDRHWKFMRRIAFPRTCLCPSSPQLTPTALPGLTSARRAELSGRPLTVSKAPDPRQLKADALRKLQARIKAKQTRLKRLTTLLRKDLAKEKRLQRTLDAIDEVGT